jgi:hypothetical protein
MRKQILVAVEANQQRQAKKAAITGGLLTSFRLV